MKSITIAFLAALGLSLASAALAEVTLDQLDQAMEAESDSMEAFRIRLQDPDPNRARAAMRLLIAEGGPAQRRLAINHGFDATDPVIRLEAVRAILDSGPLLLFRWTPEDGDVNSSYSAAVRNRGGDIEAGNVARVPIPVGPYSEEEECWTLKDSRGCLARINAGELSFLFHGSWSQFVLDTEGRLVGRPNIQGNRVEAVADLTQ
ncbi:hypothetical protein OCH239_20120 [Roseivivax halodurans JCM 10272]|uniref:Uncharacterized protein n=1 Tax=Roseivivax halodurans JCM 10272 TaxID=1449350 RepID=X7E8D6_9RHOB|nr:hypothetical protein [Roseivivax halodurans]ETX11431.1 hypothetical protein OCH239_20120 [Roseivivax halodurans JCM 10272]